MEHAPLPPSHGPVTPEASLPSGRTGLLERWRKKRKKTLLPQTSHESAHVPETLKPERRRFGGNILALLGIKTPPKESPQVAEVAAPETAPFPPTPEQTPQYERASRMRRFARTVLAHVLGEAGTEPAIAAREAEPPLTTQPLVEAAQELNTAATDLGGALRAARKASQGVSQPEMSVPARSGGYEAGGASAPVIAEFAAPPVTFAERINNRLRRLESTSETTKTAVLAAIGLGVIAVLVTGAEYAGRRNADRKMARETGRRFKDQEVALAAQQAAFAHLRQERAEAMDRQRRGDYYQRLGNFTHEQAAQTREAAQELQEVTDEASQVRAAERPILQAEPERRTWRLRQPEAAARERMPQPLARVESADTVEQAPVSGSHAGTGFFGGGVWQQQAGHTDQPARPAPLDQKTREAERLAALHKAQQARLRSNAWLYGVALVGAVVALVLTTIFVG